MDKNNVQIQPDGSIQLLTGDAITVVIIADDYLYDKFISVVMTSLVQFKNVSLKYVNEYILGGCDPCLLIFVNRLLYTKIEKNNITPNHIQNVMKNVCSSFSIRKSFIKPDEYKVGYRFHQTDHCDYELAGPHSLPP